MDWQCISDKKSKNANINALSEVKFLPSGSKIDQILEEDDNANTGKNS